MKKVLAIYGAGGLGREVLVLAKQINQEQQRWSGYVFIDDIEHNRVLEGQEVVSFEKLVRDYEQTEVEIVIAIGEPAIKEILANKIIDKSEFEFATLIHPTVYVPEATVINQGCIVCANCYISCNVTLEEHVLVQPLASVGHDCKVGGYTVISTYVTLAGACKVGYGTYIGMSVSIKENTKIGKKVIIGMGSAVFRDIDDEMIVMGNPARPMKKNIEQKVFK